MISALIEDELVEDALQMLQMMENDGIEVGVSSWNSLLAGCVRGDNTGLALQILGEMASSRTVSLNAVTFNTILPIIPKTFPSNWLKVFHGFVLRKTETTQMTQIEKDRLLVALTAGYSFHGSMVYASRLFENVNLKSPHLWICIISGFLDCKRTHEAFNAFREMSAGSLNEAKTLSRASLSLLLPECSEMSKNGLEIHAYAIRKGLESSTSIGNALMAMYSKMRNIESIHKVFQRILEKDIISWNTMVASYAAANKFDEAFELFRHMLTREFELDEYSFSSVLHGSGHLSHLRKAITLHGKLIKNGLSQSSLVVQNALIDVYGKSGSIQDARKVFDEMVSCDIISWNTIISCYGFNGCPQEAILLFEEMKLEGLKPNRVTFIALLSAFSHAGMVDQGLDYFKSMSTQYGIIPDVGHYACIVDNMGRLGELGRAYQFIKDMPMEPDDCIWSALLSSCRIHGNLELAEVAAKNLVKLKPQHSGYWVLLSNVYSDASRWDDVANVRAAMKDGGVKKCHGYSWVEIGSK
ncbi:hypothetical protein HPP92_000224 [Vanilla planifolia]|uniref:Pentatricopeptide repeat-containing protein n=1 Tax=Vanilla planifolia TaxID=51239 RepID=A0A835VII3_VANPL|nr:hypothetical protein HPP92_000224 [Vanilla planifolia]